MPDKPWYRKREIVEGMRTANRQQPKVMKVDVLTEFMDEFRRRYWRLVELYQAKYGGPDVILWGWNRKHTQEKQ